MKKINEWKVLALLSVGFLVACDTEEEAPENNTEEEVVEPEDVEEDEDLEEEEPEEDPDLEDEDDDLEVTGDSEAEEVLNEVSDRLEAIESFSLETSHDQHLEDDSFYTEMIFEVTKEPARIYSYGTEVEGEADPVEAELYLDEEAMYIWREGQPEWDSFEEDDAEEITSALFEKEVGILLQYLDQVEFEEDNGLYIFDLALEHDDIQEVSYNIGESFLFHTQERTHEAVESYELTFTVDSESYLPVSSEELTEGEVSQGELSELLVVEMISWDEIDEVEEPDGI